MTKSFSLQELAHHISAKVVGDPDLVIFRLASIMRAQRGDLTFLAGDAYRRYLADTKASAVILTERNAAQSPVAALIVENPEFAFAQVAELFLTTQKPIAGIHPTAVIAKTAKIDASVSIGAYCVIGERVVIGANTIIHSHVVIEDDVVIGNDCVFHHHISVHHHVAIHNRVILHSGVVIGDDGFGLAQHKGQWKKIPQLGSVVIHDDVEIGTNTCIDRGALENTVIENGVKIDNLVQIAHNVVIGAHTVIAGCTGVAGSTKIGKHCMIAGSVAIGGHLTICDGVIFTGCAMVTKSVNKPGIYSSGTGLMPNAEWRKSVARFRRHSVLKKSEAADHD